MCTLKNPKVSTGVLLQLICKLGKVAATRSIKIFQLYFYVCISKKQREILKIPFTMAKRNSKYLGLNLTEVLQNLHIEKYKTLLKTIKDENKRKVFHHVHGLDANKDIISLHTDL